QDSVVVQALDLMKSGEFAEAETLLGSNTNQATPEALRARSETQDILRRTRVEYSLDAEGLLAKVRKSIPAATVEDVERWAKDTNARYRMIDGKKLFFR